MADKFVLHEAEVREYISRLTGICEILDSLPDFLHGNNAPKQNIRLTKDELGGYEEFHATWSEICDNRLERPPALATS